MGYQLLFSYLSMVEEGMGRDQWPPPPNGPVWRRHINIYINLSYGTYMSSKYYTIAKNVNIDYTFGELGVAFSNWLLNTAPQKSDFPTQSLTSRGRRQAWSCRGSLVTPHLTERHTSPLWAEPREQGDGLIAHRQGRAGRGSRQWTSPRLGARRGLLPASRVCHSLHALSVSILCISRSKYRGVWDKKRAQ